MEREKIKEIIRNIISYNLGIEVNELDDTAYLLTGGYNIESIMMLETMITVEDEFGISFEDNEMVAENFNSINSILNMVMKKLEEV